MKKSTGKKGNGGFSLVELIIVIAIMAVLVGVLAPQYLSYMHKAKVAADQANLKNYFTEIQMDYITTGKYNSMVPTVQNSPADYMQREIHFLNGQTVKLKAGYFAVTEVREATIYALIVICARLLMQMSRQNKSIWRLV